MRTTTGFGFAPNGVTGYPKKKKNFFPSHLLVSSFSWGKKKQNNTTFSLSRFQVFGCGGDVVTPNNNKVGLCDAHATGNGAFLEWVSRARADKSAGSFPGEGWYPVGYCTQRGHTRWLGAYKEDPKTGERQRKCVVEFFLFKGKRGREF